jgi:hypothetical protein
MEFEDVKSEGDAQDLQKNHEDAQNQYLFKSSLHDDNELK